MQSLFARKISLICMKKWICRQTSFLYELTYTLSDTDAKGNLEMAYLHWDWYCKINNNKVKDDNNICCSWCLFWLKFINTVYCHSILVSNSYMVKVNSQLKNSSLECPYYICLSWFPFMISPLVTLMVSISKFLILIGSRHSADDHMGVNYRYYHITGQVQPFLFITWDFRITFALLPCCSVIGEHY